MISIVIPLYNKAEMVARTLRSVVGQTYEDYEIIVVDDGSTDGSAALVESLHIPRLRLVRQENAGVSAARNRGIREAQGELVALLDADDEWKPLYLATQHSLSEKYPDCDVFVTNYELCDAGGKTSPTVIRRLPFCGEDGELSNYFEVASCSHPPICSISVMVRRAAILSVGGFPEGVRSGEDLLTWARLAARYRIAFSRKPLAVFHQQPSDTGVSKVKERFSKKDFVLDGLEELESNMNDAKKRRDLHKYILRWYKIQCVIMLEMGAGFMCIKNAFKALLNGGKITIFIPLILLGVFPHSLSLKIIGRK